MRSNELSQTNHINILHNFESLLNRIKTRFMRILQYSLQKDFSLQVRTNFFYV